MKNSVVLLLCMFIFMPIVVNAVYDVTNPDCTDNEKLKLRDEALKVSFVTEKYIENNNIYYKINVIGLPTDINVQDNDTKQIYNGDNLNILKITPGGTKNLLLAANSNSVCDGYSIFTKTVIIPYYNKYKDNPLCTGNEEYFLCKENTSINIDEAEFERLIKEYIKEKNTKPTDNNVVIPVEEKVSLWDNIMSFLSSYYIYILLGIIVLGTTGILIIEVRKRRSIL